MKREAEEDTTKLEEDVKQDQVVEQPKTEAINTNQGNEPFIKHPKIRVAIIVGYNGVDFCGSQKNPDVRTVEEELEKAMHKLQWIADFNFGDLKKIGWSRATRTDKKVHALQNVFSCKLHLPKNCDMEEQRAKLNATLPADVKVFNLLEVSSRFNAKNCTSNREYSYYLPSFTLSSINELYLGTGRKQSRQVEAQPAAVPDQVNGVEEEKVPEEQKKSSGIKIIRREPKNGSDNEGGVNDDFDDEPQYGSDLFLNRNTDHVTKEQFEQLYSYRLTDAQKKRLEELFKQFMGSKKYHNYSRDVRAHQSSAVRFMIELECNTFMYINRETFEVTDENDPNALEFIHFYLKGQAFLYNQIRKMIGVIIQIFRGELDDEFLKNSQKDNVINVALAPGDGLLLEKVCYDKYNEINTQKKNDIMLTLVTQAKEVQLFREDIVKHIAERELKTKAFTCWLSYFDDFCEDFCVRRKVDEQQ